MDDDDLLKIFDAVANRKTPDEMKGWAERFARVLTTIRHPTKGQTLLHRSAGYGNIDLTKRLISQGAEVNALDNEGQSPLHYSACHGHPSTSKKLLEAGARVNLTDKRGWTPLHFALSRRDNNEKVSPKYWEVTHLLLKYGADPTLRTISGRSCVSPIENKQDRKQIRQLYKELQACPCDDMRARDEILNYHKHKHNYFELVKSGDDKLDEIKSLTTQSLLNSHLEYCDNITPLHRAAGYNQIDLAKFFLEAGARVDALDNFGRIPLYNAAQFGHVEMIELLVDKKSDLNHKDKWGFGPLHIAAKSKSFAACQKLIVLGASKYARCQYGNIPYDLAESDDVREVLKVESNEIIPSTFDQGFYIETLGRERTQKLYQQPSDIRSNDELMLDVTSDAPLFRNPNYEIKKVPLEKSDRRYAIIARRMQETIVTHTSGSGGLFRSYVILGIELILNRKVWTMYKLACERLRLEYGIRNERLLFHGSKFIDDIQTKGFDEKYAHAKGMFGPGIYFAEHSSKSNQYTFGFAQGCEQHNNKSCYLCERKMIYAQVALGKSLTCREAIPESTHGPPGYSSITGMESQDCLQYPEYVIYRGDQAYPLYVIRYKILP